MATYVEKVYGLPSVGLQVDIETCPPKYIPSFSRQVKLGRKQVTSISFRQLKDKLEFTSDSTTFGKLYILFCIGKLLVLGNSDKVSLKYGAYLRGDFASIKKYNWSQHVVDISLAGLIEYKAAGKVYLSGDINFIILHLLDSVVVDKFNTLVKSSCSHWNDGKIGQVVKDVKQADRSLALTLKEQ
ncbi:hypothetical protein LINGRAHAP2_LOCUS7358 [Linum grandiflorum]